MSRWCSTTELRACKQARKSSTNRRSATSLRRVIPSAPPLPAPAFDHAELARADHMNLVAYRRCLLELQVARMGVHLLFQLVEQLGQCARCHGGIFGLLLGGTQEFMPGVSGFRAIAFVV